MISGRQAENTVFGGLEAGGTKVNCVIGQGAGEIIARRTFPTTTPEETLAHAAAFFSEKAADHGGIRALGIAHFGPVEIHDATRDYGRILQTVKPGWTHFDVVGYFADIFSVPIAFQSDVNGAAIGERHFGAARDSANFIYVTVGTGIGGGAFVNGQLVNGLRHPEIGHMLVPHDRALDPFPGCCPAHGDCLEGLASGPAIANRWGNAGESLTQNPAVWALEAHYLAVLCVNLTCCYGPEKIIFGGGVMVQEQIFPLLRRKFHTLMQGYGRDLSAAAIRDFIVPTPLAGDAALRGALVLARQAYARQAENDALFER